MLTRSAFDTFRRLALVAVLALLAVCAPAFFAGVARAAEPTQLSADVAPRVVVYHGSAVISGTISVPNAALDLLARRPGETDFTRAHLHHRRRRRRLQLQRIALGQHRLPRGVRRR